MRPRPLDLTQQFKALIPLCDLLHVRQDLRWLYETLHAAANSSGNENLLAWLDALKSEGETVNDWIAIEIMRLADSTIPPSGFHSRDDSPITADERRHNAIPRTMNQMREYLEDAGEFPDNEPGPHFPGDEY